MCFLYAALEVKNTIERRSTGLALSLALKLKQDKRGQEAGNHCHLFSWVFFLAFIGWQIQLIPGELVREKLQPTQRWSLFYLRSWQTEKFVSWALVVVSLVFFCRTGFIPGDRIRFDRLKTDSARQVFAVWFQFPLVSSGKSPSSVRLLCVMCNSNKLFFNMNRK